MHGEKELSFVCNHLIGETSGLGFHCDEPTPEDAFPDAWCNNCERIRESYGDWDGVPEGLCTIVSLCSDCYERSRIRNSQPTVSLDDLANLRWKCASCDEWHRCPMLDLGYDAPFYWKGEDAKTSRWMNLVPRSLMRPSKTFLDTDFCAIDDKDFFVRGIIHLPILGAAESFRWGVWGSLSRENFETLLKADKSQNRADLPAMFSWLSTRIDGYPDTLSLKMFAHIQEPGVRPHFWLERADHSLAREFHRGISPERVREIMLRSLPATES
jgi:hypothetical protein